ncbi:hypothetical protein [Clostridium chromiireducens]|nr:hypothetical protein [Clostridium chromiireducens]
MDKKLVKSISFMNDYEEDLYEYANSIKNFTRWVKIKLKEELKQNNK